MKDLIEALTILGKYQEEGTEWPTHCEHDVLYVMGVTEDQPTAEEKARLAELDFLWMGKGEKCWGSFRFGSA